jgi:hypothetical protein
MPMMRNRKAVTDISTVFRLAASLITAVLPTSYYYSVRIRRMAPTEIISVSTAFFVFKNTHASIESIKDWIKS